jgi:hypothetical protein
MAPETLNDLLRGDPYKVRRLDALFSARAAHATCDTHATCDDKRNDINSLRDDKRICNPRVHPPAAP